VDDIKELVLKHEREISQLTAIQQVMVEQINKLTESIETMSEAIVEIKTAIKQQGKELKTAMDIKNELLEINKTLLLERQNQKDTNKRIFERIERLESNMQEVKEELIKLRDSTTFARWLDDGFKVLSKKSAVAILLILGLIVLGAFLGIDLHNLLRK
jgi:chromosome segregation ATPase